MIGRNLVVKDGLLNNDEEIEKEGANVYVVKKHRAVTGTIDIEGNKHRFEFDPDDRAIYFDGRTSGHRWI